jgi:hypothetical protein
LGKSWIGLKATQSASAKKPLIWEHFDKTACQQAGNPRHYWLSGLFATHVGVDPEARAAEIRLAV